MKATCIKWDTDGDKELLEELPKEVDVPESIVRNENGEIDYDGIGDYLSDVTGFCHEEFKLVD